MSLFSSIGPYALLIASAATIGTGAYALAQDWKSAVYRSFFLFTIGAGLWTGGIALLYLTHNFLFDKVTLGGGIVLFAGLALFSWVFPERRAITSRFIAALAPLATAAILLPFNVFIRGIAVDSHGLIEPINGPLLGFYLAVVLGYGLFALARFIRAFRRSRGIARLQMKYLMSGVLAFFLCLALFDAILPFFGIYELNLFGPLSSSLFVIAVAYAIVRHELMDIKVVIERGIIYSILIVLIIAAYEVILDAMSDIFGRHAKLDTAIATTIVGIFSVPHIERWFRKISDRIFFKGQYDYAHALKRLSECLNTTIELDGLIANSEALLAAIFRASRAQLLLSQDAPAGAAMTMPIVAAERIVGGIALGEKRSGDPYTVQDRHLLETFAHEAAIAIARAQLYEQVRGHAAHLEEKVHERTEELRLARENERQMMLEIAHGLQTPLAVFQTKLEELKAVDFDAAAIQKCEISLADLSHFIANLLKLAQLEGGSIPFNCARIDFSALLKEIVEEVGILAAPQNIALRHAIESGIAVEGDAQMLREAVMNIVSNAMKHLPRAGKRQIAITLKSSGGGAVLTLADTGSGIAPEDLPHIFERFYRAKRAAHGVPGSGLGLPIAMRIIKRHGGTIEAHSAPGNGTSVTIRLPRA